MELEAVSFQIISTVGTARSMYIEAIGLAKEGRFAEAEKRIAEGKEIFVQGHHVHMELLTKFAEGEKMEFNILLMHAEDQMMMAEGFCVLAEEFIGVYRKMQAA